MRSKQVCWHEGMLVLPHHFQSAEENLRDWMAATFDWLQPCSYGLLSLEVNEPALADFEVRIPSLSARYKDGTLVSVPENANLDVLNVRDEFLIHPELYIHLLLPNAVAGRANTAPSLGEAGSQHRFASITMRREELNSGENSREVDFYDFNLQLKASPSLEPTSGFESLPLMKLRRSSQPGAVPERDPSYIPPVLNCACVPGLYQRILLPICSQLGSYIKTQSEAIRTGGGWDEASSPANLRRIMQLNAANSAYPYLLARLEGRLWHPFDAYAELCRVVGQLSIARSDWEPPPLPKYDHDELGEVFRAIQAEIDAIFRADAAAARIQRYPFVGTGSWLEVSLDSEWLEGDFELYIGIKSELQPETLDRLFADSHLDWKLGSSRTIAQIYQNAESGLQVQRFSSRQSALPQLKGVTYFRVEDAGLYWQQLLESPTLALKVNDRFIRGSYTGKNALTVVDQQGAESVLTFDLFVLKNG